MERDARARENPRTKRSKNSNRHLAIYAVAPYRFGATVIFTPLLHRLPLILSAVFLMTPVFSPAAQPESLTYGDLTRHLWDPEIAARLPREGDTGAEFSSYDRTSRYDGATGRYSGWGANEDQMGCLRFEGDDAVWAEMKGPGCIWRIWSATPRDGHVRIYIDGETEPAIDFPFISFFDGKTPPFNRPNLVYVAARGYNNYTPIPFKKSCKVVASPGWGHFYQISYSTFAQGMQVPSLSMKLSPADAAALDEADSKLGARGTCPTPTRKSQETIHQSVTVLPGQTALVAHVEGPRAITALRAHIANLPASPADRKLLRELCLKITWDDAREPAVWAPLGDFFGTAPGVNSFQSLMSGLTTDGHWYSYWYMPFEKAARVEVINETSEPQQVDFDLTLSPLSRPAAAYGQFHAKWHRNAFASDDLDRTIDWTLLKTTGRGRFVGAMLHIWSLHPGWWGEGDEKFFVDGEKFPSSFGTGSEDYFGYAWCDWHLFDQAFHGQTIAQEDNAGHTCVHRWQLADNVPFQKSFEGAIEKYFSDRHPTLYASTVYWYLQAGGTDPYKTVPVTDRNSYWENAPLLNLPKGLDAIEGDSMEVKTSTGGRHGVYVTDEYAKDWPSGLGRDLALWIEGGVGDVCEYKVHWLRWPAGQYRVYAHFIKRNDSAIVQPYLNGVKAGEPIDLYAASPTASNDIELGVFDLKPGIPILKFVIVGKNASAVPRHSVALESFRFRKEP